MDAWHQMVPVSPRRRLLFALAAMVLITSSVVAAGRALAAGPPRLGVPGTLPAWATPANDTGPVPAGAVIDARVYLAGRDTAGLAAYARQVSQPGSPGYAHYLTSAQYQQRFGPTAAQVSGVRQWLVGAGMDVTAVTGHYVAVRGAETAAAAAFGTSLDAYRVAGASQRAPRARVSVPAAVAPAVLTVTGLSASGAQKAPEMTGADAQAGPAAGASPADGGTCSAYWGQQPATTLPPAYGQTLDYTLCGYVPAQLRAAYGVSRSGLTGKGVTIAIVDPGASPTIAADVNTYAGRHGGHPLRPGQLTQDLPSDIAQSCLATSRNTQVYYGEETLDIEAAHAMAPDADIAYVGADCPATAARTPDASDMLDAETRIVDGHLASIVNGSWPLGTEAQMAPGIVAAYEQVFEQGAVEGIGFYFSSGDQGDWSAQTPGNQPAVQFPASDPWVTSVGGTSLATGPHGGYKWETGWGQGVAQLAADGTSWTGLPGTFRGGAGGGPSSLFTQPFYQHGVVPAALSEPTGAAGPMRVMPDIAADADPATGMLIGQTRPLTVGGTPQYTEFAVGGTSVSAPLIVGIQADAQQARHGVPIGFANPAIYARYGTAAYHDVTDQPLGPGTTIAAASASTTPSGTTNYSAVTFARDSSLHATTGYDDVTGVGTPSGRYLNSYRIP
jgi:subtilase family serine protease